MSLPEGPERQGSYTVKGVDTLQAGPMTFTLKEKKKDRNCKMERGYLLTHSKTIKVKRKVIRILDSELFVCFYSKADQVLQLEGFTESNR